MYNSENTNKFMERGLGSNPGPSHVRQDLWATSHWATFYLTIVIDKSLIKLFGRVWKKTLKTWKEKRTMTPHWKTLKSHEAIINKHANTHTWEFTRGQILRKLTLTTTTKRWPAPWRTTVIPTTWEAQAKLKSSLRNIARPWLKKTGKMWGKVKIQLYSQSHLFPQRQIPSLKLYKSIQPFI